MKRLLENETTTFVYTYNNCLDKWQQTLWISAQNEIKQAIAELHKQQTPTTLHCMECHKLYPCPTIQTINGGNFDNQA
jgi:hypothetical protein